MAISEGGCLSSLHFLTLCQKLKWPCDLSCVVVAFWSFGTKKIFIPLVQIKSKLVRQRQHHMMTMMIMMHCKFAIAISKAWDERGVRKGREYM